MLGYVWVWRLWRWRSNCVPVKCFVFQRRLMKTHINARMCECEWVTTGLAWPTSGIFSLCTECLLRPRRSCDSLPVWFPKSPKVERNVENRPRNRWIILVALLVTFTINMAKITQQQWMKETVPTVSVCFTKPRVNNSGGKKNQAENLSRTLGIRSERCSCKCKCSLRQRTLHREPTVASYLNPLNSPLLALNEHLWWKCM